MISAVKAFKLKMDLWSSLLKNNVTKHFSKLDKILQIMMFVSNPLLPVDIGEPTAKFHFWGLVNRQKYPLMKSWAPKVKAYFGSTYLCEMAFSQMKIIKSKCCTHLTDAYLRDRTRLAISNYDPDFKAFTDSVQAQVSHEE